MRIEFKDVILHNFLSYGHSEISLNNKGYCLVSGTNRCAKDHALSNGSGKSSWISAICWVLTGETVQGVTKDLKNVYIDEDLCYVTLKFKVDNDIYEVTRYYKPKSDLKIKVNNEDKSGKGIRESEIVLASYLPDLTKELLTSVILLGQGLPNKLTSFTPVGRKELLEKLSKSDFMIEDIKSRINSRSDKLSTDIRTVDNDLLVKQTQLNSKQTQLDTKLQQKKDAVSPDYDYEIKTTQDRINSLQEELGIIKKSIEKYADTINDCSHYIDVENQNKQKELTEELTAYNDKRDVLMSKKLHLESEISSLDNEIIKLKNIKDVCPTCGRPFEGVIKPDTTEQENRLNTLKEQLFIATGEVNDCNIKHNNYTQVIEENYYNKVTPLNNDILEARNSIKELESKLNGLTQEKINLENRLYKLTVDKENEEKNWKTLLTEIETLSSEINTLNENINTQTTKRVELNEHLDTIKKMDTLVKRDFRGYLLSNVINFIDMKAKEYCTEVFGSDEINFILDGNNIDISYCGKSFESLSGGEKQKVDIILQFAIRDMMSKYLDFSSNILCLDEIFDNLDSLCTTSVLNLINNKINDVESLFIISHHSDELSIPSDCELSIVKNEQGISEVR